MFLYHGTNEETGYQILDQGILPRTRTKKSNWKHTIESNPDAVYLSDAYPMYFAIAAMPKGKSKGCVVEVDVRRLLPSLLAADEDVLEQVGRQSKDGLPGHWDIKRRTTYYRNHQKYFATKGFGYEKSLQYMGTCAYLGAVPLTSISRVAFFDTTKCRELAWAMMDPTITLINYRFCQTKYRWLTKFLFHDHEVNPKLDAMDEFMCGNLFSQLQHTFDYDKAIIVHNNPAYDAQMRTVWG